MVREQGHPERVPDGRPQRLRARWGVAAAAGGALALVLGSGCGGSPPVRSVVLVSIDSLRADHLGAYGYPFPTSPTVDSLAREGLVFERAYASSSWTLPSHAAMLTGLDDLTHGVRDRGRRLPDEAHTLAEILREHDVVTTGFYSGPHLHPAFGLHQGFDEYFNCTGSIPGDARSVGPLQHAASRRDMTNPILERTIDGWLAQASPDARHFVFIHMWDVHHDFIAPQRYVERFDPDYDGALTGEDFMRNPAIAAGMDPRDLRHLRALYDAEIRFTDDTLGRLLAGLRRRLGSELAILVVSDHGEELLEHGGKGHQRTLHEEVLRVPLVVSAPGFDTHRSEEVVGLVDVAPTVCDLLGIPCELRGPGTSLLARASGRATGARPGALADLFVPRAGIQLSAWVSPTGKIVVHEGRGEARFHAWEELDHGEKQGVPLRPDRLGEATPAARAAFASLEEHAAAARDLRRALGIGVASSGPDPATTERPKPPKRRSDVRQGVAPGSS